MHGKTRNALLGYGLDTDLIEKIAKCGHTIEVLRALSRKELLKHYTEQETERIKSQLERQPIPDETIQAIPQKSGTACCYCNDGNSTRPYQIHHISPYSETQDNSEENLLLVCPTHHVAIHANKIDRLDQKSVRKCWHSIVAIASTYADMGIQFPFGLFQPLDYTSPPKPSELVEFSQLSPSTSLICFPEELANAAIERLKELRLLVVLGVSGSGKSTYITALGGLMGREGYDVFRHRFDKHDSDALKQTSLFVSTCVRKTVLLLDDVNTWASPNDLDLLFKLVEKRSNVLVIASWTNDDSNDGAKLQTLDLPKQLLTWSELRPAVVEALIQNEREVVEALKKYEPKKSIGALGFGYLDSKLTDRIRALGDKPKTVYEFIFGLRGDAGAIADELRLLIEDGRSDLPVLFVAIEQIADFERPVSVDETFAACIQVQGSAASLPTTKAWVGDVLARQCERRKLVKIRDHYTTIHRKWAAGLIATGIASSENEIATKLLKENFQIPTNRPERLIRLWSWLRNLDEARPFIKQWVEGMSQEDWSALVKDCASKGLLEVGFLAGMMHLLRNTPQWKEIVGLAFSKNVELIAPLVYNAEPTDWYWLKELEMGMEHACPSEWTSILIGWDRKAVAELLLKTKPDQFDHVWWALGKARTLSPGWLEEVGQHFDWAEFKPRLSQVAPGDLNSLSDAIEVVFQGLRKPMMRSTLRDITELMVSTLRGATVENLRMPMMDTSHVILAYYFPDDARRVFDAIDQKAFATQLSKSLPRHWRSLVDLSLWTKQCGSNAVTNILAMCDFNLLLPQVEKYGLSNRHDLRVLLHFLCRATPDVRSSVAKSLYQLVCQACAPKDSEASEIAGVYQLLDKNCGAKLISELKVEPKEFKEEQQNPDFVTQLKETIAKYQILDASGQDYAISLD